MISPTTEFADRGTNGQSSHEIATERLTTASVLFLSAWCGLVAGSLEVTAIVLRKRFFDSNQLYGMSRHFIWLVPTTNLCLFLAVGLTGCVMLRLWPRPGRDLFFLILCALTLLPMMLVGAPQIYGLAWLMVALGAATRILVYVEKRARRFRQIVKITLPLGLAAVMITVASLWVSDRGKRLRENALPMPPARSPNVLLIVMDTVAAGHLSLHGYSRATSTALEELAGQGIKFESARAASSWTLPSHAAMFTGRWMHELSVGWKTPLDDACPALAEFLSGNGYATAGFVANTTYCARDSGLDRGFTEYRDFIFPGLSVLKMAVLASKTLAAIEATADTLEDRLGIVELSRHVQSLAKWFGADRKPASVVNRELLDWLSQREQPERPFFAFLNYFDAHYPYRSTTGSYHRFGGMPTDTRQHAIIEKWWEIDKTTLSPQELAFAATAYDDCIADLDEQIGCLVDRLRKLGFLEHTWLFIAADHGESFGEHAGIFCHGASLYQTELHVPLLIVPPAGRVAAGQIVKETVSLRDLPATIVDAAGQGGRSPFPGRSLARFWNGGHPGGSIVPAEPALAEVVPNPNQSHNVDSAGRPKPTWPLGSLHEAEWSYIRREHDTREELFRVKDDPNEERNLATDPAARSTLERLRRALDRVTSGPLLPARFRP